MLPAVTSDSARAASLAPDTATSTGASASPLPAWRGPPEAFPQLTLAPSSSTHSPPTLHSRIAQPIAARRRLSIVPPVRSDTPHSRATACAEAPLGSAHTM